MDAPAPGGLGGTYAGNPLAIAAVDRMMPQSRPHAAKPATADIDRRDH